MPLYNFVCPVCGEHFEKRRSFHDDAGTVICPNGHAGARRVYSAPTIVYKTGGFYVTDSRKKSTDKSGAD